MLLQLSTRSTLHRAIKSDATGYQHRRRRARETAASAGQFGSRRDRAVRPRATGVHQQRRSTTTSSSSARSGRLGEGAVSDRCVAVLFPRGRSRLKELVSAPPVQAKEPSSRLPCRPHRLLLPGHNQPRHYARHTRAEVKGVSARASPRTSDSPRARTRRARQLILLISDQDASPCPGAASSRAVTTPSTAGLLQASTNSAERRRAARP